MDGQMHNLHRCVFFLSRLPFKKTVNPVSSSSLPCISQASSYLTLHPFDTLFISVSLSLHLLCLPHSLLLTLSHFLFPSLIYYSHPSLTLSLLPLTPGIPPSAAGRLDLYQQCIPPRKRNRLMNKRTERGDR